MAYKAPDDALSNESKNAVQNKVIDEELSDVKNAIDAKQDAPSTAGTAGQVLSLDNQLNPVWSTPSGSAGDAGEVSYDETATYQTGTVGAELSNQSRQLSDLAESPMLCDAFKTALLNCFAHVAWIDQNGQDYYDALYNSMRKVVSISAVFTQGANYIWNNDTLDDLTQYLVVTATYDDSSTEVLSDAEYTLSGTLATGTSTITVTYSDMTDTFDVVVTAVLYPLENGTHTFSKNSRVLTVTNGCHFVYEAPNATSDYLPKGAYLNLSTVSDNDTSATTGSNITGLIDVLFTFPAGSTAVLEVKNLQFTNKSTSASNNMYNIGVRNGSAQLFSIGDHSINTTEDISVSYTFESDTDATCVFAYFRNQYSSYEADLHLTVDGIRWF